MISLWLFAWLLHYLNPGPDTWYAFPLIMTGIVCFVGEFVGYSMISSLWDSE